MRTTVVLALAAVAAVSVGCGGDDAETGTTPQTTTEATTTTMPGSPTPSTSTESTDGATVTGVDVVVIGDSLTDPSHCGPSCVGFGDQYTTFVGDALGVPATYHRLQAMDVPEAVRVVSADDSSRRVIADAEVVIVEVGFNNALPDPETGIGCGGSLGSTNDDVIDWILSTEPNCLAEGIVTYGQLYDQIFASIKELRGAEPTVFVVTNSIDGNIDPSADGLLRWAADRSDEVLAWILGSYERWNGMIADRAAEAGFEVVDLWRAFNGPDGTELSGDLAVDTAHPSQKGNDLIAAMLAEVDLSALTRQQTGS